MTGQHKKKILFLHETLRQGGTSRQILYLYRHLDRSRFRPVFVLYRKDRLFHRDLLGSNGTYVLREKHETFWKCMAGFRRILQREAPDGVQSFNPRMNHFLYLSSLFFPVPPIFASVRNTNLSVRKRALEFMFRSRPRNLIVNSAAVEEELVKRAGIPRDKIRVIENALDASRFVPCKSERVEDLRARNGMDGGTFLILSVGRIHRQKNIICTLKALARLKRSRPDARLTFLHMGFRQSSRVYGEISAFIEKNNMGGMCRFMDPVHEMVDFYNMADAVVVPSLWEGLPNVVLEAMSCGRITIIAESADNDGIVEDGVTGFKFKTNDDVGLCRVLERVMDMDEDRERLMARRARRRVTDRFSIRRMVEKFQDLYETV